jgi:hypothetical protein
MWIDFSPVTRPTMSPVTTRLPDDASGRRVGVCAQHPTSGSASRARGNSPKSWRHRAPVSTVTGSGDAQTHRLGMLENPAANPNTKVRQGTSNPARQRETVAALKKRIHPSLYEPFGGRSMRNGCPGSSVSGGLSASRPDRSGTKEPEWPVGGVPGGRSRDAGVVTGGRGADGRCPSQLQSSQGGTTAKSMDQRCVNNCFICGSLSTRQAVW